MRVRSLTVVAVVFLVSAAVSAGAGALSPGRSRAAPLPSAQAPYSHAPFLGGECATCHVHNDARNPGALLRASDQLCFDCHDEYSRARTLLSTSHREHVSGCVGCHNPHNAARPALLF